MASQFDVHRHLASSPYCCHTDRSILRSFFSHAPTRFDVYPYAFIHKLNHCVGDFWVLVDIPYPTKGSVSHCLYPAMLFTKR
ncbi:Hypothetical protein GLP15_1183 [Giardia lamblia P15]|uniref:Uncharacterized protein n=1 Tax=Giardia intestinalis (strain P15) TaxID=658858 RepID=E1F1E0_GIAIA|nr:Hypothetical protein GLP15_1183 [Giardia lamblia P15]